MGEDCVTADDKALGELPYRRGVGAALFNGKGEVWVGRRIAKIGQDLENYWQLPQGGIDHDEAPSEAVFRELLEETGTNRASIVAELHGVGIIGGRSKNGSLCHLMGTMAILNLMRTMIPSSMHGNGWSSRHCQA
jgi:8-oxo-dGTP pyrophosphatase MutT (NUDIX family)